MKLFIPAFLGDDGLAKAAEAVAAARGSDNLTMPAFPSAAEVTAGLAHCGSYARLPFLLGYAWLIDPREWLRLLFSEWDSMDNIGHYLEDLWDTPFADVEDAPENYRHVTMTPEELAVFYALPNTTEVYRGCYAENKWGLSWSLERGVAECFPNLLRYSSGGQPLLVRGRVRREHIIALKIDRGETEIICHKVKHISTSYIKKA